MTSPSLIANRLQNQYDVDRSVEKLRMIANELELSLKRPPLKKT